MKFLLFAVLLSATFALAQDNNAGTTPDNSKPAKDQITVQGCVSRLNGDFVLIKQDPGVTYELQGTGKVKIHSYMGQRVEVTGRQSPSLSTSSDAMNRSGSASPVTITVTSIKTIDKECPSK
jgi:hypothetical protein